MGREPRRPLAHSPPRSLPTLSSGHRRTRPLRGRRRGRGQRGESGSWESGAPWSWTPWYGVSALTSLSSPSPSRQPGSGSHNGGFGRITPRIVGEGRSSPPPGRGTTAGQSLPHLRVSQHWRLSGWALDPLPPAQSVLRGVISRLPWTPLTRAHCSAPPFIQAGRGGWRDGLGMGKRGRRWAVRQCIGRGEVADPLQQEGTDWPRSAFS